MTESNYMLLEHRDEDNELIGATCRIGSDSPEIPLVLDDGDDLAELRRHLDNPIQRTSLDQNPYRIETAGTGQVAVLSPENEPVCFVADSKSEVTQQAGPLVDYLNRNDRTTQQE